MKHYKNERIIPVRYYELKLLLKLFYYYQFYILIYISIYLVSVLAMNKYNLNNLKNTVVLLQYNRYDERNPIYFK